MTRTCFAAISIFAAHDCRRVDLACTIAGRYRDHTDPLARTGRRVSACPIGDPASRVDLLTAPFCGYSLVPLSDQTSHEL